MKNSLVSLLIGLNLFCQRKGTCKGSIHLALLQSLKMGPKIFISIASYRDPVLPFTLDQAMGKAKYPECVFIGVVDQNDQPQHEKIKSLSYADRVRYIHVHAQDTLGVSWARSLAFSLYDGEEFILQVDSHTFFEQDWDETLMNQYWDLMARTPKPILSTYPMPFEMDGGTPKYDETPLRTVLVLRPNQTYQLSQHNAVLAFHARHLFTNEPVLGCHVAAGFLFTKGEFVNEVPYDPFLYFHGEEQSLALRAFTRGWDIYHPVTVPVRHLYKVTGQEYQSHHWHGDVEKQRAYSSNHLTQRAKERLMKLVTGKPLGVYGLGNVRTMEQYRELSGIDYKKFTITDIYGGKLS